MTFNYINTGMSKTLNIVSLAKRYFFPTQTSDDIFIQTSSYKDTSFRSD